MKRLSASSALLCAIMFIFSTLAFTGRPGTKLHPGTAAATPAKARQALYYWYCMPGDTYNDQQSVSQEELEWWIYYDGVLINTIPNGGTLIVKGYLNNAYPHNEPPYYSLYAHFE